MEIEKESLLKLRRLEQQLLNIIDKVDKEINQVDVEWLNLRSIAVRKLNRDTQNSGNTQKTDSKKLIPPIKKDFKDNDFRLLDINLELNPVVNVSVDEEFDSD